MNSNNVCLCVSLLLGVIYLADTVASCDSGRIFVGSINETYPDKIDRNGIYILEDDTLDGHPIYKHENKEIYLYHISGNIVSDMWVIGEQPGSLMATLSLRTDAAIIEDATEFWQIWSSTERRWVEERHLKAVCVDIHFRMCTGGHVLLHGLSPWNHHQHHRTGDFYLTNETYQMRPVYSNENQEDYLYYIDGLWMVGPNVGRISAGLFVLDYAWRPEYIIEDWIVFNGRHFIRDTRLRVTCPESGPISFDDDEGSPAPIAMEDILQIAEGILDHGRDPVLPVCGDSYCENGGTCIRNEVDDFLCACPELYVGVRCEQTVECGPPPVVANGNVVSQSGSGFRSLVFYSCVENTYLQGPSAATCQNDGTWSEPPRCVDWLDFVSPGVSQPERRSQGLMNMVRGRGNHHHRRRYRNVRSVHEEITIDDMKAMF